MRQRIHSSSSENTKQGNPSPLLTRSATVTAQTDLQRSRFPENADNETLGQNQNEPPITAPLMSFDWTKIPVDAPGHPTTIPIQPKFLGQISHHSGQIPFPIQAKLTIGQPNDRYEQEADRMARQVVNQINRPATAPADATVQRQDAPEDEERLQRKASLQNPADGMAAPPELEAEIGRSRSGGQPLAAEVQQPMEQAFGADFSGVKLHTDAQADQLNRSIQAKAFTTGQNIFFRQGAYQPGSRGGQELIAHELTHVMQQNGLDQKTTRIEPGFGSQVKAIQKYEEEDFSAKVTKELPHAHELYKARATNGDEKSGAHNYAVNITDGKWDVARSKSNAHAEVTLLLRHRPQEKEEITLVSEFKPCGDCVEDMKRYEETHKCSVRVLYFIPYESKGDGDKSKVRALYMKLGYLIDGGEFVDSIAPDFFSMKVGQDVELKIDDE